MRDYNIGKLNCDMRLFGTCPQCIPHFKLAVEHMELGRRCISR
jgi:hypothetical protein